MARLVLGLACLAVCVAMCTAADLPGCMYTTTGKTSGKSFSYNVNSLVGTGTGDANGYFKATDAQGQTYMFNICGGVEKAGCATAGSAVCQVDNGGIKNSCGTLDSAAKSDHTAGADKGFVIKYSKGDVGWACDTPNADREMTVIFTCDKTASTPVLSQVTESETEKCAYEMTFSSKVACPVKKGGSTGGLSTGSVLLIVCACSFFVYAVGGIGYNMKANNKPAGEAFPNVEFWKDLPALTKDGFMFVVHKTCSKGGSYQEVAE